MAGLELAPEEVAAGDKVTPEMLAAAAAVMAETQPGSPLAESKIDAEVCCAFALARRFVMCALHVRVPVLTLLRRDRNKKKLWIRTRLCVRKRQ